MKSFFGEAIVFHQQTDHSQPELVYSSELSLQTVINAAFKQSASEPPAPKASSREERTTKDIVDMTDRKRVLYQAAMIVKADINETSGIAIQLFQTANISLEVSKASVPESLCWLLRLIVSSEDTESVFETPECPSSSDERRILMIGQDIVHSGSHGKVKTPTHMAVCHLTGSKQIFQLWNRMGHCASYDTVEMIDKALAGEIIAKTEAEGVAIPSIIAPVVLYSLQLITMTLMKKHWTISRQLMLQHLLFTK